jgi:hypothetical protein
MQSLMALLISVAMAVHAILGCCAHHEHPRGAEHTAIESHQFCHCSSHHTNGSEEKPVAPQDCDETNCVFVASKHSDSQAIDGHSLFSLTATLSFLDLGVQHHDFLRDTLDDVPYHEGTALRVWQCVWKI